MFVTRSLFAHSSRVWSCLSVSAGTVWPHKTTAPPASAITKGNRLIYAARTRNGFTPVTRAQLFKKFKALEVADCPFANLPEAKSGRWGQGLTKARSTLHALNIELHDEQGERHSPIMLPAESFQQAVISASAGQVEA